MDLTFAGYRLLDVVGGAAGPLDGVTATVDQAADHPSVPPGRLRVHDAIPVGSEQRVRLVLLPPVDGELVRRSLQRARTVDHPHLVPDLEVVEQGGRVAVVAPWTTGGTLDGLLRRRDRLTPGEALTVLRPLAGALTAIGDAGLQHGALIPELIWFDDDGRPRLAGLTAGLALAEAAGDEVIVPVGAPHLAPEVARGARPDLRSDLFSLGSVALLAVSGRPAWPAVSAAEVLVQSAAGLWPQPDPSLTSPELAVAISGLLAADPGLRPPPAVLQVELRAAGRPLPVDLAVAAAAQTPGVGAADAGPVTSVGEEPVGSMQLTDADDDVPTATVDAASGRRSDGRPGPPSGPSVSEAVPGTGVSASGPPRPTRSGSPRGGRRGPSAASSGRRRRRGRRHVTRAAVLGVAVLVGGGVAVGAGWWWAAGEEPASAALTQPSSGDASAGQQPGSGPTEELGTPRPELAAAVTTALSDPPGSPAPGDPTSGDPLVSSAAAAASSSTDDPPSAAVPGSAVIDWLDVVRSLDQRRAQALSSADPAPLDAVYVAGPPLEADRALVADLRRRGLHIDGGTHVISAARVSSGDTTPSNPGDEISVEVEQSLPSYPVVDGSGQPVGHTPAVDPTRSVLVLRAVAGGFAIVSVRSA
ncbi:hypothetical protein FDO65_05775 [Nakamurella flava]|uniref:Protein kinase domain-containing protein n=1 Tax=Nakamurella flava TaxID=2576308 RepID=A0A4U6QKU0_9ACTN|nr:protein kinase [Nakamurella flava]TKV61140.1 hypothetical protein FDO65_05775 [Nakamurella flava]